MKALSEAQLVEAIGTARRRWPDCQRLYVANSIGNLAVYRDFVAWESFLGFVDFQDGSLHG